MMRILKQASLLVWVSMASFNLDLTTQEQNALKSNLILSKKMGLHSQIALMMDKIQAMLLLKIDVLTDDEFNEIKEQVIDKQKEELHEQAISLNKTLRDTISTSFPTFSEGQWNKNVKRAEDEGKKVEDRKKDWDEAALNEKKALDEGKKYQEELSIHPCTTAQLQNKEAREVASFLGTCNTTFKQLADEFGTKWSDWNSLKKLTEKAKTDFEDERKKFKTSFCALFSEANDAISQYQTEWNTGVASVNAAIESTNATYEGIKNEDTGLHAVECLLKTLNAAESSVEVNEQTQVCMDTAKTDLPRLVTTVTDEKTDTSTIITSLQTIWKKYNHETDQQGEPLGRTATEACQAAND